MSSMREKQQPSPYAEKPWLKHYDYWKEAADAKPENTAGG